MRWYTKVGRAALRWVRDALAKKAASEIAERVGERLERGPSGTVTGEDEAEPDEASEAPAAGRPPRPTHPDFPDPPPCAVCGGPQFVRLVVRGDGEPIQITFACPRCIRGVTP